MWARQSTWMKVYKIPVFSRASWNHYHQGTDGHLCMTFFCLFSHSQVLEKWHRGHQSNGYSPRLLTQAVQSCHESCSRLHVWMWMRREDHWVTVKWTSDTEHSWMQWKILCYILFCLCTTSTWLQSTSTSQYRRKLFIHLCQLVPISHPSSFILKIILLHFQVCIPTCRALTLLWQQSCEKLLYFYSIFSVIPFRVWITHGVRQVCHETDSCVLPAHVRIVDLCPRSWYTLVLSLLYLQWHAGIGNGSCMLVMITDTHLLQTIDDSHRYSTDVVSKQE